VDEGGVFAAAASSTSLGIKSFREETTTSFRANRPFVFALYDFDAKLLLFLGVCEDPSQNLPTLGGSL
jgi:serine protease inhibitor